MKFTKIYEKFTKIYVNPYTPLRKRENEADLMHLRDTEPQMLNIIVGSIIKTSKAYVIIIAAVYVIIIAAQAV